MDRIYDIFRGEGDEPTDWMALSDEQKRALSEVDPEAASVAEVRLREEVPPPNPEDDLNSANTVERVTMISAIISQEMERKRRLAAGGRSDNNN